LAGPRVPPVLRPIESEARSVFSSIDLSRSSAGRETDRAAATDSTGRGVDKASPDLLVFPQWVGLVRRHVERGAELHVGISALGERCELVAGPVSTPALGERARYVLAPEQIARGGRSPPEGAGVRPRGQESARGAGVRPRGQESARGGRSPPEGAGVRPRGQESAQGGRSPPKGQEQRNETNR